MRANATTRGYDSEWRRLSKLFLARPENAYCDCGAPSTLVRHCISIQKRPDLRLDQRNWLPGCARCNARDAARERALGANELGGRAIRPAVASHEQLSSRNVERGISRTLQKARGRTVKAASPADPVEVLQEPERPLRGFMFDHVNLLTVVASLAPSVSLGKRTMKKASAITDMAEGIEQ